MEDDYYTAALYCIERIKMLTLFSETVWLGQGTKEGPLESASPWQRVRSCSGGGGSIEERPWIMDTDSDRLKYQAFKGLRAGLRGIQFIPADEEMDSFRSPD